MRAFPHLDRCYEVFDDGGDLDLGCSEFLARAWRLVALPGIPAPAT